MEKDNQNNLKKNLLYGAAAAVLGVGAVYMAYNYFATGKKDECPKKKKCCGPGYATPLDAFNSGKREKLVYVPLIPTGKVEGEDTGKVVTVDVDPNSKTYSQVISTIDTGVKNAELHHSCWNACSSCHGNEDMERRFLIFPELSERGDIFIVDTKDKRNPKLHKIVSGEEIKEKFGLTFPHSGHCLPQGVLISYMGNKDQAGEAGFLLLDFDFNPKERWEKEEATKMYGYDFWIQFKFDVMVSSEWGHPSEFKNGFNPANVASKYGKNLHFWSFKERKVVQSIDLGNEGLIPLETRFLHNPEKSIGYVGAALSSNVIAFYKEGEEWKTKKVIDVEALNVEKWALPQMPGLITDILISLDDKFIYFSNWLHGDIRQYDISDPLNPVLTGQIFVGGSLRGDVKITSEGVSAPQIPTVKGNKLLGGPQMIQLSLDGKRLYVTNSLYSPWDKQFYPDMLDKGSQLLKIDVDTEKGGLKLDKDFYVEFNGYLAHEVRYPGGDCSSDIYYPQN